MFNCNMGGEEARMVQVMPGGLFCYIIIKCKQNKTQINCQKICNKRKYFLFLIVRSVQSVFFKKMTKKAFIVYCVRECDTYIFI